VGLGEVANRPTPDDLIETRENRRYQTLIGAADLQIAAS
jgi:hypothetical protein